MFRLMIAVAAMLVPAAAAASPSVVLDEGGYRARVSYSDLNLASPAGQAALKHRIERAAGMVCFDSADRYSFGYSPQGDKCYRAALASGTSQMDAVLPISG